MEVVGRQDFRPSYGKGDYRTGVTYYKFYRSVRREAAFGHLHDKRYLGCPTQAVNGKDIYQDQKRSVLTIPARRVNLRTDLY